MFTLFRPTYTDRKTGETRGSGTYNIRFRDHMKRRQTLAAFADQRRSNTMGNRVIALVSCRRDGAPLADDVRRWLDGIDDRTRARLVEMDLLDARTIYADKPLTFHLDGETDAAGNVTEPGFRQELLARGTTELHVTTTTERARKILDGCGFVFWKDLAQPSAATRISVYLAGRRDKGELSGKSFNYYIRDFKSFCRWMADTGRAPSMALSNLHGVKNAEVDADRRRALSVDEVRWLLKATVKHVRAGLTGDERALLYRFGFETGLRPGQIRQLTVASFDLSAEVPTVTADARWVKRRKVHTQLLRPALAADLKARFKNKLPAAPAFRMSSLTHLASVFRKDLKAARDLWIEAAGKDDHEREERQRSDFLAEVNHQGERAVFYSIRHGHGTALADAGVPEKDIAASMHHATRTTTARYLHSDRKAVAGAIAAMPDLDYPLAATGTDGKAAATEQDPCLRNACAGQRRPVASGGLKPAPAGAQVIADSGEKTAKSAVSDVESRPGLLAELADALDSKSCALTGVSVRLR